jgi:hypothetical protein
MLGCGRPPLSLLGRRRDRQRPDARHLRRHDVHDDAARIRHETAGDVQPDAAHRQPALRHRAARRDGDGLLRSPLALGDEPDAPGGLLERCPHRRVEARRAPRSGCSWAPASWSAPRRRTARSPRSPRQPRAGGRTRTAAGRPRRRPRHRGQPAAGRRRPRACRAGRCGESRVESTNPQFPLAAPSRIADGPRHA